MKKVFSVLLALMLMLGCIPSLLVSAETTYAESTVAVLGGIGFSSLQEAIDAAMDGEHKDLGTEIKLVKDLEFTSADDLSSVGSNESLFIFSKYAVSTVTIDGDGHTITMTMPDVKSDNWIFRCAYTRKVTIKNLKMVSNCGGIYVTSAMKLTLDNCELTASGSHAISQNYNKDGYVVVNKSTIKCSKEDKGAVRTLGNTTLNNVTAEGTSGAFAVYTDASKESNATSLPNITINGGTFTTTTNNTFRLQHTATKAVIKDATVTCGSSGGTSFAANCLGDVTFDNCTVIADNAEFAIQAGSASAKVTILSGTYIKKNDAGTVKDGGVIRIASGGSVIIYGGTFLASGVCNNQVIKFGTSAAPVGYLTVYGGDFYQFCNHKSALSIAQVAATSTNAYIYGGNFHIANLDDRNDSVLNNISTSGQKLASENYTKSVESDVAVEVTINGVKYNNTCKVTSFASAYSAGAQLKTGTTADSESTAIRLVAGVNSTEVFKKVGYVISLSNTTPTIGGTNVTAFESTTVYTSVVADGVSVSAHVNEYLDHS